MIDETKLRQLYCDQKLSMAQIAAALGTTHATVLYWLKKHGVARRTWSESTYAKLNAERDPFTIPETLTPRQQALLQAALMLYWAEGSKAPGRLRITNLDHRMLQVFAAFLRQVCHINEKRLRLYVRVYETFDKRAAKSYWVKLLGLPTSQVFVYPHLDRRSKPSQQWSPYGIATLEFHSTKLRQWVDQMTEDVIREQLSNDVDEMRDEPFPTRVGNRLAPLFERYPVLSGGPFRT